MSLICIVHLYIYIYNPVGASSADGKMRDFGYELFSSKLESVENYHRPQIYYIIHTYIYVYVYMYVMANISVLV